MKYFLPLFLLLGHLSLFGQVDSLPKPSDKDVFEPDAEFQNLLENLAEDTDSESGISNRDGLFETLENYLKDPIDLNKATPEKLAEFGLLSDINIQALLAYRKKYGDFLSLYELKNVPTFDAALIQGILPYIQVEGKEPERKTTIKRMFQYGKHVVFTRWNRILETQRGYTEPQLPSDLTRYAGSPDRLYLRYRFTYKDKISAGFTAEKDPGESFFKGDNKKGFDFYSYHIAVSNLTPWLKTIVIGDFSPSLGQGLTIWGGFPTRKGNAVTNVKKNLASPVKPFTSVGESMFYRGIATSFQVTKKLEITGFFSKTKRDANLVDTTDISDDEALALSSFYTSGLHRTPSEIVNRNTVSQTVTGGRIRWVNDFWTIAANAVYSNYSKTLSRTPDLYNRYYFNGKNLLNVSLDYSWFYQGLSFFGETAVSDNGGYATVNGFTKTLDETIQFATVFRHLSKDFVSVDGAPFMENSQISNETGLYMGAAADIFAGSRISAYADMFRFNWLKFNVDAPSNGYDYLVKWDYSPHRRINLYVQYKDEQKARNLTDNEIKEGSKADHVIPTTLRRLRLHVATALSRQWELRNRIEFSWYKDDLLSKGFVAYQDIIFRPEKLPLSFSTRFAIFDAVDYDARIYAYENDVLYGFSAPAYSGRGYRVYFNASWEINRHFTVWLRYAQTKYTDRETVGSGYDLINGSRKSEVKIQARMKF